MNKSSSPIKKLNIGDSVDLNKTVIKVGTRWCGACKKNASTYNEIAVKCQEYGYNIVYYDIDAEKLENSDDKFVRRLIKDTKSYPTFYFFKNGKLVEKMSGFDKSNFRTYIKRLME